MLAADPDWSWERLPFLMEARRGEKRAFALRPFLSGCTSCQAMGKEQSLFIESSQNQLKNAHAASMVASFNLWKEQLLNDQSIRERQENNESDWQFCACD